MLYLAKEQHVHARKLCIETILHTDMMSHNSMVKELQILYEEYIILYHIIS